MRPCIFLLLALLVWIPDAKPQTIRHLQHQFTLPSRIKVLELHSHSEHVVIRRVRGHVLRINTSIHTNIRNPKLLELFIQKGRYEWQVSEPAPDQWTIHPVGHLTECYQQNSRVQEELTYLVWLPRQIKVLRLYDFDEATAANTANAKGSHRLYTLRLRHQ